MNTPISNEIQNTSVEYEICVAGHLDTHWSAWLEEMQLTHRQGATGAETCLRGALADAAALHGLLTKLYNLNLILVSVQRLDRRLEGATSIPPTTREE
jgi:hypothetical protein